MVSAPERPPELHSSRSRWKRRHHSSFIHSANVSGGGEAGVCGGPWRAYLEYSSCPQMASRAHTSDPKRSELCSIECVERVSKGTANPDQRQQQGASEGTHAGEKANILSANRVPGTRL